MPDASKIMAAGSVKDKKDSKELVKLPTISPVPVSPAKPTSKTETRTTLPLGTSSTPPSPYRKNPSGSKKIEAAVCRAPSKSSPLAGIPLELIEPSVIPEPIVSESPTQDAPAHAEEQAAARDEEASAVACAPAEKNEAARIHKENGNGSIKLIYEQYDELFPITDGSTTQAHIDEVYCLSFVMPNCLVHISYHPSAERFERENMGIFDSLAHEEPPGTYHGLVNDQIYYVVVEQEEDQLRRDQETTKSKWAPTIQCDKQKKDDGRGFESCSCIYGNPCVDEYGCKDWHSRFAVATASGWKGF